MCSGFAAAGLAGGSRFARKLTELNIIRIIVQIYSDEYQKQTKSLASNVVFNIFIRTDIIHEINTDKYLKIKCLDAH